MHKLKLIGFIIHQYSLLGLHQSGGELMKCPTRLARAEAHRQLISLAFAELFKKNTGP